MDNKLTLDLISFKSNYVYTEYIYNILKFKLKPKKPFQKQIILSKIELISKKKKKYLNLENTIFFL